MSRKITQDEFEKRFYKNYPECDITVLQYTAMSNPAQIRCNICGKIYNKPVARQFINGFDCCNAHNETRLQKVVRQLDELDNLDYVKQVDDDHIIIRCNKCGNEFKRALNACLDCVNVCPHCNENSVRDKNTMSKDEAQRQIDRIYGIEDGVELLEYNGQLKKNTYRCKKCGFIFKKSQNGLLMGTSCPKCSKYVYSKGEDFIAYLLDSLDISYIRQYSFKELPRKKFDFAVFKDNKKLDYLIEVQGGQHYRPVSIFGGEKGLSAQQERDEEKRAFCAKNNITLYEILYDHSKLKNLDILPFFSSTTISAKGSTVSIEYWK